jgi:hypothetical protein
MPLDILDLVPLLDAAARLSPESRNELSVRMVLAEACDVSIDFLRQACGPSQFRLNEAQHERLQEAVQDFRVSESDRARLGSTVGAAVQRVEAMMLGSMQQISEDTFTVQDGHALISALEQYRALLRAS